MKLSFFICLVTLMQVSAASIAQKISLSKTNATLTETLREIGNQSGYSIFYEAEYMVKAKSVTINVKEVALEEALKQCFSKQPFTYAINNRTILIAPKTTENTSVTRVIKVTGIVTDIQNEPLQGVNVKIKGSETGTITDNKGVFFLDVPDGNSILVFSSVGYTPSEIRVNNRTQINVTLAQRVSELESVIITGYQTISRKDFSGSVSSINSKQISDVPANSTLEALTGRLAGVQIVANDGAPGSPAQIKLRGGMSISQDNSPLYVIDGIQTEDGISFLSPQDIESVDVLKDASSTAIYGARGANGVIVITTKGGKEGKTIVAFNSFAGIKQMARKLEVMDPYNFVTYQWERSRREATDSTNFRYRYGATWEELEKYKDSDPIDWQEKVFGRNAFMTTNNVSVSGGEKNSQFNVSATQNLEEGIMERNKFGRKILNFRFDHSANRLRVGITARYNRDEKYGAGTNTIGGGEGQLRHSIKYRPLIDNTNLGEDDFDPLYLAESNRAGFGNGVLAPNLVNAQTTREGFADAFNVGGNVNYRISKLFNFKSTVGYILSLQTQNSYDDSLTYNSRNNGSAKPILKVYTSNGTSFNNSNVLTFSNANLKSDFNKNNRITVLLGQEINLQKSSRSTLQLREFANNIPFETALGQQALGKPFPANSGPETLILESNLASLFTKFDYAYKGGKYTASFSLRADKSSKFAIDKNVSYFPAGSLSWKVTEEKFMQNITAVNYMKLRASFGLAGNNRIDDYLYLIQLRAVTGQTYGLNNVSSPALVPPVLANSNLRWERTLSRNLGLDVGLFQDRLSLSVDYYSNKGTDLLMNAPIPSTSGYSRQIQNVASILNRGLETQLTATVIKSRSFNWTSTLNFSFNKSTIKKVAQYANGIPWNSNWGYAGLPDFLVQVGQPVGAIYGYVSDGFYTLDDFNYNAATQVYSLKPGITSSGPFGTAQPGSVRIKDLNGDGLITDNGKDQQVLGKTNPDVFGGLNQQFAYKNFDLSVFLNFSIGNKVLNASKLDFTNAFGLNVNTLKENENRWRVVDENGALLQQVIGAVAYGATPERIAAANPNPGIWQPIKTSYATAVTSWGVEDGSFLRVNNITFGYSLPANVLSKIGVKKLRVYTTLNNIAIITGYTGQDPEVNTQRASPFTPGVDYSAYPRSHSYLLGLNLTL